MKIFLWECFTREGSFIAVVVANNQKRAEELMWKIPNIDDISDEFFVGATELTSEGVISLINDGVTHETL